MANTSPTEDRSVLIKIKTSPTGLRRIANILEQQGKEKSVRINWYTVQIEFVYCDDPKESAI